MQMQWLMKTSERMINEMLWFMRFKRKMLREFIFDFKSFYDKVYLFT